MAAAVLPLIKHSLIQDLFRSGLFIVNNNPFITRGATNYSEFERVYREVFNVSGRSPSLYSMVDALKNTTNRPEIYEFVETSFYGWSPVCLSDFFSRRSEGGIFYYKVSYMAVICVILSMITVSYCLIVKEQLARPTTAAAARSTAPDIRVKVAKIVGMKLVSWLFLTGLMIYVMVADKMVLPAWYEMTGVGILPANSALNPMFHADLTKVQDFFKNLFRKTRRPAAAARVVAGAARPAAAHVGAGTRPPMGPVVAER